MTIKRIGTTLIVLSSAILLGSLVSCGMLSPEQQSTALQVVDQMFQDGTITQAQYDALREIVLSGSQREWWMEVVNVVGGAALAYAGIQLRRGPPTQRVGLPESKVKKEATQ